VKIDGNDDRMVKAFMTLVALLGVGWLLFMGWVIVWVVSWLTSK